MFNSAALELPRTHTHTHTHTHSSSPILWSRQTLWHFHPQWISWPRDLWPPSSTRWRLGHHHWRETPCHSWSTWSRNRQAGFLASLGPLEKVWGIGVRGEREKVYNTLIFQEGRGSWLPSIKSSIVLLLLSGLTWYVVKPVMACERREAVFRSYTAQIAPLVNSCPSIWTAIEPKILGSYVPVQQVWAHCLTPNVCTWQIWPKLRPLIICLAVVTAARCSHHHYSTK